MAEAITIVDHDAWIEIMANVPDVFDRTFYLETVREGNFSFVTALAAARGGWDNLVAMANNLRVPALADVKKINMQQALRMS